ncbi:homing endonuclease [Yersinia phage vB_YenP_Rambo]|uniref:Homing endonuclease n=1 Tax=Yersinia phage vB_YenP_Rambo TaxID=2880894 RepID=A0AC61TNP9_9CAUD|nr:homing endonuclease [Yersinia phage vB_YenP_Rambo]
MFIDHINRIRDDNRIENLRLATVSENNSNCDVRSHCKSGAKYIATTKEGRFHVRIKRKSYGSFDTLEEAVATRDKILNP